MTKKQESTNYLDEFIKNGSPNLHLRLTSEDREYFAKFSIELYKEITPTTSLRQVVLITALIMENYVDLILKRIFKPKEYKNYESINLFAAIPFYDKIKLLKEIQKTCLERQPAELRIKAEHFSASIDLREEFGSLLGSSEELERIQGIMTMASKNINKKRGVVEKPYTTSLEFELDRYLDDEVIDMLQALNLNDLLKLNENRNKAAHEWDIPKFLGEETKRFCLGLLSNIYSEIK